MPTYPYVCEKCGEHVKFEWTISEYDEKKDSVVCPKCGAKMVREFRPIGFKDYTGDFYKSQTKYDK